MSLINGDEPALYVFDSVLSPSLCRTIVEDAKALTRAPGAVGGAGSPQMRSVSVAFFPAGHWLQGIIDKYAWEANQLAGWNYALHGSEAPQFSRYEQGGHYDWHVDTFAQAGTTRKLSLSIQLSPADAYDGGDLQLRRHGVHTPQLVVPPDAARNQGSIIVFPSYQLHRVTPVSDGVRDSLVGWVRGPRFT